MSKTNEIYIVFANHDYESSEVVDCYLDKAKAEKRVLALSAMKKRHAERFRTDEDYVLAKHPKWSSADSFHIFSYKLKA